LRWRLDSSHSIIATYRIYAHGYVQGLEDTAGPLANPLLRNWTDRGATAADMRDTAYELHRVARHLAATVVRMVR
jgi:hypothetical protein